MMLDISSDLLERIREHGKATYPLECCGLLLGGVVDNCRSVGDLRPLRNAREDSQHNRYLIAPSDLLAAEKEASRLGLDIIGVYHSHPDHPARPSKYDLDHAFPWYSYVIVSVANGEPLDLNSWVLREDRSGFDAEPLVVREARSPTKCRASGAEDSGVSSA